MGRLAGTVDDDRDVAPVPPELPLHGRIVPDVGVHVPVSGHGPLESLALPARAALLAEEHAPHVVVDADHGQAAVREEPGGLGADEPGRTRDERDGHRVSLLPASWAPSPGGGGLPSSRGRGEPARVGSRMSL